MTAVGPCQIVPYSPVSFQGLHDNFITVIAPLLPFRDVVNLELTCLRGRRFMWLHADHFLGSTHASVSEAKHALIHFRNALLRDFVSLTACTRLNQQFFVHRGEQIDVDSTMKTIRSMSVKEMLVSYGHLEKIPPKERKDAGMGFLRYFNAFGVPLSDDDIIKEAEEHFFGLLSNRDVLASETEFAEFGKLFIERVKFLLALGIRKCSISSQSRPYMTLLDWAAFFGSVELCQLVWERHAPVKNETQLKRTLLMGAEGGNVDVVQYVMSLLDHVDIAELLYVAAKNGHVSLMKFLMERGADPKTPYEDEYHLLGDLPLHATAQNGHVEAVKVLLKVNVDVNATNGAGMTALNHAVFYRRHAVVHLLLENGADPSNCLITAARAVDVALVQLFLKRQMDPNAQDRFKKTALHYLCRQVAFTPDKIAAKFKIVQLLLDSGARLDLVDVEGNTPLQLAEQMGNARLVRVLKGQNGSLWFCYDAFMEWIKPLFIS